MRTTAWAGLMLAMACGACGGEDEATPPTQTASSSATAGGSGAEGGGSTSSATTSGSGGAPSACARLSSLPPGEHQRTIDFDGHTRDYEVQVPLSYDGSTAVPLVLDLHGFTSDKDQQQLISGIEDIAEREGFVVVRPNGYGALRSWNAGDFCCGDAQAQQLDDVGLMKAIVAAVSSEVCIDPRRVYATGLSNGGAMSHRLACDAADVFAATAPVSYPIDFTPLEGCKPSRPIAVMHSHGKNDLIVPYDGSATMHPTLESFAYWASVDGCTGMPAVTYSKGSSTCETYESCDGGVQVALCSVNGGHVLYTNADDVPIGEISWKFLSQFTLP